MNPIITRLREELAKNKEKIAALQGRNRELEKQIRELENIDIIGMVRARGLTLEQFTELFREKPVSVLPPILKEEPDHADD